MEIKEIEIVGNANKKVERIGAVQDWGKVSIIVFNNNWPDEWIKLPSKKVVEIGEKANIWIRKKSKLVDVSIDNEWDVFWKAIEVNEKQ